MSSMVNDGVRDAAEAWLTKDDDASTCQTLQDLLKRVDAGDAEAAQELNSAFSGPLQFGTAGLRGAMGPGPNRMNLIVVSRAAAGIGMYLSQAVGCASIVIGYDARYNSRSFAERSAAILTAAGHSVTLMPDTWPTPVLAFAVRRLNADCGIMVTASHNPAGDNGYKVYLGGRVVEADGRGVQIFPPVDANIAACIASAGPLTSIERADSGWDLAPVALWHEYLEAIAPIAPADEGLPKNLRVVYSAMHGVGQETMQAAFSRAGFTDVLPVREQAVPDPDFPTVPFPNPEEDGAIDLALALAEQVDADLVIASDPDADRCAAAIYDPRASAWRMLHGDELGILLANYLLQHRDARGTFAHSIVSSRALSALAQARGVRSVQTLTGFKWITRAPHIAFGYEEAIGYCVLPNVVKDKDGISAALAIAQLAAIAKARGSSLVEVLDDLAREIGLFHTAQVPIRVHETAQLDAMMTRLRAAPPANLCGSPVRMHDLSQGSAKDTGLPPTNGILLLTDDGTRVIVRPSGTEPKVKAYLEVVAHVNPRASYSDVSAVRERATRKMTVLKQEIRALLVE